MPVRPARPPDPIRAGAGNTGNYTLNEGLKIELIRGSAQDLKTLYSKIRPTLIIVS